MKRSEVELMSGPELVVLYHKLTGKKVLRFASRSEGVRRCLAALGGPEAAAPAPAPAAGEPAEATATSKAPRAARRTQHVPSGPVKPPRPGTKRAALLAKLLGDGLSADAIGSEFEWKPTDVKDALRLLAAQNGYCVYLADDGVTWRAAGQDAAPTASPERKRATK